MCVESWALHVQPIADARACKQVSKLDSTVDIFGQKNAIPLGIAPTAMQCLAHEDGELGTARACKNRNVAMGLSSFATKSLEEVAEASGSNANALQLYLFEERAHSKKLIQRAKRAGFKAVFLTVDTPMLGRRNLEIRNQFKLPGHFKVANFVAQGDKQPDADKEQEGRANEHKKSNEESPQPSAPGYTHDEHGRVKPKGAITFHTHAPNPTLSWESDIEWLKQQCKPEMQVFVKGIATGEDAILAVHHGVDGIIVSNHGGRQLST